MKLGIALFAILHCIQPVLIEVAKEFHDVGSSKLMAYQWGDWLVLAVSCAALAATNLVSFCSTKWGEFLKKREGIYIYIYRSKYDFPA